MSKTFWAWTIDQPLFLPPMVEDFVTSGGLLIACDSDRADAIGRSIQAGGYPAACIIARAEAGRVTVKIEG